MTNNFKMQEKIIRIKDSLSRIKDQTDELRLTENEREGIRSNIFDIEDLLADLIKPLTNNDNETN